MDQQINDDKDGKIPLIKQPQLNGHEKYDEKIVKH